MFLKVDYTTIEGKEIKLLIIKILKNINLKLNIKINHVNFNYGNEKDDTMIFIRF